MNMPRELFAGPEGELCQRPVAESSAVFTKTLFQLDKPHDVAAGCVLRTPDNYMFECSVQLDPQATLSINLREQPEPSLAYTLSLSPKSQEISLNGGGRHCKFDAGKPIKVQAFVQGTVLECFVNDRFAFSCRDGRYPQGALSFKVNGGNARLLKLAVKTLAGDAADANGSAAGKAELLKLLDIMSMEYNCPSVNKRFMHLPISSGARNVWVGIRVDGALAA